MSNDYTCNGKWISASYMRNTKPLQQAGGGPGARPSSPAAERVQGPVVGCPSCPAVWAAFWVESSRHTLKRAALGFVPSRTLLWWMEQPYPDMCPCPVENTNLFPCFCP